MLLRLAVSATNVVAVGSTEAIKATVKPANAKVSYKTSDAAIATVDAKGVVTGVKAGDVTITVSAKSGKKTVSKDVKMTVKTLILKDATQEKATQIEATFAGDTSKLDKKDIVITNTSNNVVYPVKAISVAADKTTVKIDTYSEMNDGSWILDGRGWYTYKYVINQLNAGSYSVDYVFDQETKFDAKIVQVSNSATLNSNKLSVTKGFTKTLKVNDGIASSWSSSNSSVASVNHNGKITGKKVGKTTIIAHLKSGKTLKCNVTVKSNEYSAKKITMADTGSNEYSIHAYHAAYKSNGNLVIKFRVANGTGKRITSIPKLYVLVLNQKNKGIASYSKNSFKVNIPEHSVKEYSITIKKSDISGKKADLRNTSIEIKGERVKL